MKPRIELHIEELVLRDLPYEQREQIAAAVEAELQRLLSEGGLPAGASEGGAFSDIQLDLSGAGGPAAPGQVGARIAQGILGSLSSPRA